MIYYLTHCPWYELVFIGLLFVVWLAVAIFLFVIYAWEYDDMTLRERVEIPAVIIFWPVAMSFAGLSALFLVITNDYEE